MQLQGVPPAGVVADSGVLNQEWEEATVAQGICPGGRDAGLEAIRARVHPDLANIDNEPDKLVARGALTVPIIHVWNRADSNVCGATPMNCPLRDGTTKTLGAAVVRARAAAGGDRRAAGGLEHAKPARLREPAQ